MGSAAFDVLVRGEFALFSRPEFKSERVTYPVMTPSAARGLVESVFWKPEIRWKIRRIAVLKPIQQLTILRNELGDRQGDKPFFVEDKRQPRVSLVLKDVAYVVRAEMLLNAHATDPINKYADQFQRRLERGQCHHTPYLGCREFAAEFEPAKGDERPQPLDVALGSMLFDLAYREDGERRELEFLAHGPEGSKDHKRRARGYAEPVFFDARLTGGILDVPRELYARLGR